MNNWNLPLRLIRAVLWAIAALVVLAALAVGAPARGIVRASALPAQICIADSGVALTLDEARRRFEAGFVRAAIARAGGSKGRAAADLGVTRQGLAKLLDRLGLDVERQET